MLPQPILSEMASQFLFSSPQIFISIASLFRISLLCLLTMCFHSFFMLPIFVVFSVSFMYLFRHSSSSSMIDLHWWCESSPSVHMCLARTHHTVQSPSPTPNPFMGEGSRWIYDCQKWNLQACQTSPLPRLHPYFLIKNFNVLSTKCQISILPRSCTSMLTLFPVFIFLFLFFKGVAC